MAISPAQSRAARGMLDWSQMELAQRSNLSESTIRDFEKGRRVPSVNNLAAVRRAFEDAGLVVIDENGGGADQRREVDDGMTDLTILTPSQVRQLRALLRWSSPKLARNSKVSFDMVIKAQSDAGMAALTFDDVWAIRTTLERAGVRFAFDAEGQPGAELAVAS